MSGISTVFEYSELAFAAYADFLSFGKISSIDLQMDGEGLPLAQSDELASQWRVVDQYNGEIAGIIPTGLSVTLFQEEGTGRQVVAIRGTQAG